MTKRKKKLTHRVFICLCGCKEDALRVRHDLGGSRVSGDARRCRAAGNTAVGSPQVHAHHTPRPLSLPRTSTTTPYLPPKIEKKQQ
ncbi:hypothetical protein E2C01_004136 [Portunus trituberculatus]|uniref:Uncharacterized protein n=1 Tax=Portunus trituberculatus TaxID=210409 RepID=A0A5B7CPU0_PORTR|nr:hypothetical protein [Portunus trituberculatus]